MEPIGFDEANTNYGPPKGETEEQCQTVRAFVGTVMLPNRAPGVITCWRPSQAELDTIKKTGQVWFIQRGGLSPHFITGHHPWEPAMGLEPVV